MFAGERREAILDSLIKNRKVNVLELSKEFAVSQVIIRKDLKLLEAEGKLQRTHGGAIEKRKVALNTTFEDRKIINEEEKMVIAKKAYELINDNDVILMDISTINFMIARLLQEKPKRITIITQSLDLIVVLSSINEINIISLQNTKPINYFRNKERKDKNGVQQCINGIKTTVYTQRYIHSYYL